MNARSDIAKSRLYVESLPLFMRGAVSIPDHARLIRELRLLERRVGRSGKDVVDRGRNGSDDFAANDREIETNNTRARPNGAEWLAGAEAVARGLNGYISGGVTNIPRITRDLRLPTFQYRANEDYAWPRSQ